MAVAEQASQREAALAALAALKTTQDSDLAATLSVTLQQCRPASADFCLLWPKAEVKPTQIRTERVLAL